MSTRLFSLLAMGSGLRRGDLCKLAFNCNLGNPLKLENILIENISIFKDTIRFFIFGILMCTS